ncbi:MAG: carboxypeptidase-like regulatory domain-containing protein [Actinomycetota bacterium]
MADWPFVRLVKPALALALLGALAYVWTRHEPVLAAYRTDHEPVPVQLRGLSLDHERTVVPPSPFALDPAVDTRTLHPMLTQESLAGLGAGSARIRGGTSSLAGTVVGPDGPVAGATVRVERHSNRGIADLDVDTNPDGTWSLGGIVGGRYRVRAWVDGELTMAESMVLFVNDDTDRQLTLPVGPIDPTPDLSFTHRGDVQLGGRAVVAVTVSRRFVGADGVVQVVGVRNSEVALVVAGPGLVAEPTVTTDAEGVARFTFSCEGVGANSGVVRIDDLQATFSLPGCLKPPPPAAPAPADAADDPDTGTDASGSPGAAPGPASEPVHQIGAVLTVPSTTALPVVNPTTSSTASTTSTTSTTTTEDGDG